MKTNEFIEGYGSISQKSTIKPKYKHKHPLDVTQEEIDEILNV